MEGQDWSEVWEIELPPVVHRTPEEESELTTFIDAMYGPRRANIYIPPISDIKKTTKKAKFDWSKIGKKV